MDQQDIDQLLETLEKEIRLIPGVPEKDNNNFFTKEWMSRLSALTHKFQIIGHQVIKN
eukprot:CAMPEP_0116883496 /NCGR_PEP_ID=MMETSP0463-20121206/16012_1 /TAXON_ID=181622 /ORGANISM="Strombidinopsis sp, Strain SopsisLIS2011" /LENGTH=57 /DNA_ID=CAMNT_0004538307 /DNA_START=117 /DNA_END=290 /DNA_ORIENTATION=+